MSPRRLRLLMNVWPPFVAAGIHVLAIDADWRCAKVRLRRRWYNQNYVGTHFGGSLFAMTDPFWMIMVMENLGRDYLVWDKAGAIEFVAALREPVFVDSAPSHTKGGEVMLMVSPEFLSADDRILIVDDFLASGRTIDALARIVRAAGAELVGIATIVEKTFEGGRAELTHWGVPIVALATIIDMSDGQIVLK